MGLRTRKGFRVKTKLRRQLAASKRKIQRRLDKTKFPKKAGPVLAGGNLRYEISERIHGLGYGGISLFHKLARDIGLIDAIDKRLTIFKVRLPYTRIRSCVQPRRQHPVQRRLFARHRIATQ